MGQPWLLNGDGCIHLSRKHGFSASLSLQAAGRETSVFVQLAAGGLTFCSSAPESPTCGGKGLPYDLSCWSWRDVDGALGGKKGALYCTQQRRKHCVQEESGASAVGEVSPSVVPHWNWQGCEGSRNSRHMSRMAGVGRLCWWVYLCSVSLLVHGTVVYACRGRGRGERCYCECAGVYR